MQKTTIDCRTLVDRYSKNIGLENIYGKSEFLRERKLMSRQIKLRPTKWTIFLISNLDLFYIQDLQSMLSIKS